MKKEEFIFKLKTILKFIIKPHFRNEIFNIYRGSFYHQENKIFNPKNKIVIIQRPTETVGTFSDFLVFLFYIQKIVMEGKIPIIDRKTNKNYFLNGSPDDNTWEYFFEQPYKIGLEDIALHECEVQRALTLDGFAISLFDCSDTDVINYWRKIASKYIRLNKETLNHVNQWKNKILGEKRVLGVSVREGYKIWFENNKAAGHAYQIEARDMVDIAFEKAILWNCEYIFLMCQSEKTIEIFRNKFNDKLLVYPRERSIIEGYKAHSKRTILEERQNELDYITEVNILSACTSMICSDNSGTQAAYLLSNGYENFECIDCGRN